MSQKFSCSKKFPATAKHRKQMKQSFPADGWAPSLATLDILAKEHLLPSRGRPTAPLKAAGQCALLPTEHHLLVPLPSPFLGNVIKCSCYLFFVFN